MLMGKVSVTIMLMYDYVYVCLFLSTYKFGYVVVSHATKEFKSKRRALQWNKITNNSPRQHDY